MLERICAAVRAAGEIVLSAETYRGDGMRKSGDGNYVTEYDVRVQACLRDALAGICPEAAFCGEENGEQGEGALTWIVDPIDGTSNFIHGTGMCAVSVALSRPAVNVSELAAVYNPYTDEMYAASRGGGAFLNGKRLTVSARDYEHALIGFGTTPYDRALAGATFALASKAFSQALDVRRSGSAALDLAYLAAGRFDGFFEMTLQPWDYAAGALLVAEAGGTVTRFCGAPLDLRRPSSVLAGNGEVYAALRAMAAPYKDTVY